MNRWGCSLICWHVHTSSSYLHSATEVRMPKQSDSVEGRELWPLDTNLLKTPVAGREWVWKRFLWIPGILLVHSTWSPSPQKNTTKSWYKGKARDLVDSVAMCQRHRCAAAFQFPVLPDCLGLGHWRGLVVSGPVSGWCLADSCLKRSSKHA